MLLRLTVHSDPGVLLRGRAVADFKVLHVLSFIFARGE